MASICLVRHGQASFGTDDYDRLSELGLRQARLAGEYLRRAAGRIDRVVSGTLKRQRQTAAEIARRLAAPGSAAPEVRTDERLDELDVDLQIKHLVPRLDDPEGELAELAVLARSSTRSYQKLLKRVFLHWQNLAELPEDLESWPAFCGRVRDVVHEAAQSSGPGEDTVMVTSGGVIAAIVHHVLGLPHAAAYPLFEVILNCSITHLLHDRRRISLSSFNDCSYLLAGSDGAGRELLTYR